MTVFWRPPLRPEIWDWALDAPNAGSADLEPTPVVDVADTQPIPAVSDGNPLYDGAYPSVACSSESQRYAELMELRDAEASVLARLAEETAASTPWDAARAVFGAPPA